MFIIIFWTFNTSMHNAHIYTARKKLLQPNNFTPTPHHVLHRVIYLHALAFHIGKLCCKRPNSSNSKFYVHSRSILSV